MCTVLHLLARSQTVTSLTHSSNFLWRAAELRLSDEGISRLPDNKKSSVTSPRLFGPAQQFSDTNEPWRVFQSWKLHAFFPSLFSFLLCGAFVMFDPVQREKTTRRVQWLVEIFLSLWVSATDRHFQLKRFLFSRNGEFQSIRETCCQRRFIAGCVMLSATGRREIENGQVVRELMSLKDIGRGWLGGKWGWPIDFNITWFI